MLQRLQIKQNYIPMTESISVDDPVWRAWRIMKDLELKRLPVVKNGKIVGVVSDRDIVQISGLNGGQSMPVKDAMSMDPLIVDLEDSMDKVLRSMLKKDQQDAIVVDQENNIVGLFSWTCAFKFFLDFADINYIRQLMSS